LSGNSWLVVCQWFIAAERPKYLTCIAPWEGFSDIYGEFLARGGVIDAKLLDFFIPIIAGNAGEHTWENEVAMALDHPYGPYHEDHAAKVEHIDIPAYVTASYSNQIHTMSTFSAYARLSSSKWLRVHDT
jgi:predicted acyl esterase